MKVIDTKVVQNKDAIELFEHTKTISGLTPELLAQVELLQGFGANRATIFNFLWLALKTPGLKAS